MRRYCLVLVAAIAVVALVDVLGPMRARADVGSVEITYSDDFGTYGGHPYVYSEGYLEGSGVGDYRVAFVLIHPTDGGNGLGWVDLPNTFYIYDHPRTCDRFDLHCAPEDGSLGNRMEDLLLQTSRTVSDDHLFNQGFTYISVQWSKHVTDVLGEEPPDGVRTRLAYGRIESGTDQYEIMRDAGRLLRSPAPFESAGLESPPASTDNVVVFGYSQTGCLLNGMLWNDELREDDGSLIFDGVMPSTCGSFCSVLNDDAEAKYRGGGFCEETLPDTHGMKILAMQTQTELDFSEAQIVRGANFDNPDWRSFEIAGTSHLPVEVWPIEWFNTGSEQLRNPFDYRPFFRAAIENMTRWIVDDVDPPEEVPLGGARDGNFFALDLDDDGNATGGIRPPHMFRTLDDGSEVGAPLGVYQGFDWGLEVTDEEPNLFYQLAGLFNPLRGGPDSNPLPQRAGLPRPHQWQHRCAHRRAVRARGRPRLLAGCLCRAAGLRGACQARRSMMTVARSQRDGIL